jgi:putative ABC transport system substrate-binding protein
VFQQPRNPNETGYIENHNVKIEYRWAEGRYDRLSGMAAGLVRRQVVVIAATSTLAALAAKAATALVPIVFETAGDPIALGLVANWNRPGGNVTGVTRLGTELESKRLGLLHDAVPTANLMALLVGSGFSQRRSRIDRDAGGGACVRAANPHPESRHRG